MIAGRVLGLVFLAAALMAGAAELALWVDTGAYRFLSVGELWRSIHPGTFASVRVWIENDEFLGAPWLWNPFVVTLLAVPAWPTAGAAGVALHVLFRRR
ncbi:MAG: hypothetical protein O3C09_02630 [Proteobacteria bacterium]|nr:hypothetical protein [Pseudomonadota bacterium]